MFWKVVFQVLKEISISDLEKLASVISPSFSMNLVAEAICVLFSKSKSFKNFQALVKNPPEFLQQLQNIDKVSISDYNISELKKMTALPEFQPEQLEKVSKLLGLLASFIWKICEWTDLFKLKLVSLIRENDLMTP